MGDSTSSMFYAFAAFIAIYIVGAGIYSIVQLFKRMSMKKRDRKE